MSNLLARITKAVRLADRKFEKVGGSSRHWVRECLLPELETEGLAIVDTPSPWRPIEECGELEEKIDVMYLVWAQNERFAGSHIAHRVNGEWKLTDAPKFFKTSDITHIHQMGPIRRPGETR